MNTNHDALIKLMEECSELSQAASKIISFGLDSTNPSTGETNEEEFRKEVGDVLTLLTIIGVTGDYSDHMENKIKKLARYTPEILETKNDKPRSRIARIS